MKTLLIFVATFSLLSSVVFAESIEPEEVVRTLIKATHGNNLQHVLETADLVKIATQPRHGRSPENLVKFLKGIEVEKIKFQKIKRKGWPESTIVRMIAPLSVDFDLKLVKATKEKQEDHYRVVAVHP